MIGNGIIKKSQARRIPSSPPATLFWVAAKVSVSRVSLPELSFVASVASDIGKLEDSTDRVQHYGLIFSGGST